MTVHDILTIGTTHILLILTTDFLIRYYLENNTKNNDKYLLIKIQEKSLIV